MFVSDNEAQAAQAIAETTGKAIDAARDVGGFIRETIGDIPKDAIGLLGGDWLHEKRRRNIHKLTVKTQKMLEDVPPERITEPSASVVVPLLQAAADEGREELQDLWAALLTNAMVDGGRRIRRKFFDIARQMEPADAIVLRFFDEADRRHDRLMPHLEAKALGIQDSEYRLSQQVLVDLGCLSMTTVQGGEITFLGQELLDATRHPTAPNAMCA